MKSLDHLILLQLAFVLIITSGFTCQKKYPQAPIDTETSTENPDSSSENSNSTSETTKASEGDSQKPDDKADQ